MRVLQALTTSPVGVHIVLTMLATTALCVSATVVFRTSLVSVDVLTVPTLTGGDALATTDTFRR